MGWVDTHCHLQLGRRPPGELLDAAVEVEWLVVPGVDARSSQAAAELVSAFPQRVLATAGVHPHEAAEWARQAAPVAELARGAIALGETGLDYYRDLADRSVQRDVFAAHIDLARDLDKPLIVHCRDAFADVHRMVEESGAGPRAVLHCWTAGPRWTRRFLDLGVMFSFAGPIAFPTGETVRLGAEEVPPDRALVETDTPYLAPPPHMGEDNQPAWVVHNGEALARVWGMPVDEVARITTANARRIFGGPPGPPTSV